VSTDLIGTLCLGIAITTSAVLLLAAAVEAWRPRARPLFTALLVLLGLASCLAYPRFGQLRGHGNAIHAHEQYHFFLGSKYLREIRYDGIYLATVAALDEDQGHAPRADVRDLLSFETAPAADVLGPAQQVKARFSPERWAAFKSDVAACFSVLHAPLRSVLSDHGNTGSPAWAAPALLFTGTLPLQHATAVFLAMLDPLLLLVLLGTTWRVFGLRAAAVAAVLGLMPAHAYSYLGGSILRLDWLFAVGMATCMLGARRYRLAGLLLGYAISSKIFCGLIALALGAQFVGAAVRTRRLDRGHVQVVVYAVLGLLGSVLLSSLAFGGVDIWSDYAHRILATLHEGYYRSQYSFRDVFLQLQHHPWLTLVTPDPRHMVVARADLSGSLPGFLPARLLLLLGLYGVASRHDEVFATWLGVLSIFVVLVTNMYYWQMFLLLALAAGRPGAPRRHGLYLAAGAGLLVAGRLPEYLGWPAVLRGYFCSWWMTWTIVGMVLIELATWGWAHWQARRQVRRQARRQAQRPATPDSTPTSAPATG